MGTCRGLKSIYRSDPHKRMHGGDKDDAQPDYRGGKKPDNQEKDDEDYDKNPHQAYKSPERTIQTVFGGKVALETGGRGN